MTLDPPDWLEAYVREWRDRLLLSDWHIRLKIALCVCDDPDVRGLCEQQPDSNVATITLRADIENTAEWREVVIHELLHVAHARVDHAVERAIIPELASAAQNLAREVYHQHVESYTDHLAVMLARLDPSNE